MSSKMPRTRTESAGESLCPVCHESSEIYAIGTCDHPICYRCSTRMRVLCGQTYCPICRGELHQIVFLTSKQRYDDVDRRNCVPNRKYKILMEDESVEDGFEALLEYCCRECEKRPLFDSFQDLHTHMRRTHTLFACDLCVSHLKIFPFERRFYNRKDLATHRRTGDEDNRSYRGHPLCRFCDERYMDNDELLRHLRKSHYYCHFCDANAGNNEYFNDYPDLREHFQRNHFICEEEVCGQADTRFTNAFATEIDLKAHKAAEHMGNKSRAQCKELRTIDVSFQVAPRRRGRDAGVISSEDYEEVNGSNRGPRDRRHRRNGDRYESSSRNDNLTPPPEVGATVNPPPPVLDDFPTLGNPASMYVPTALPRKNEVVEDFPSLSSQKQSGSASNTTTSGVPGSAKSVTSSGSHTKNQKPVNNFSAIASLVKNSGSSPSGIQSRPASRPSQVTTVTSVSKSSWAAPRPSSGEDFPSLNGDKKSTQVKDSPNLVSLGAWTKKQKKSNAKSSRPEAQSPFHSDDEFPTLGGGATPKQASWVQKNPGPVKLGKSNTSSHKKFSQFNGSSENKTDETKSKKKKKKQKDNGQDTKKSSEDSGISLNSIASEIDAMAVIEQNSTGKDDDDEPVLDICQGTSSKGNATTFVSSVDNEPKSDQGESGKWETVVNRKSVGFQEDDFPTLGNLPKKTVAKSSATIEPQTESNKTKNSKSVVTVTSKALQGDDFPALSSVHEKKSICSSAQWEKGVGKENRKNNEGTKKSKLLLEDDFPTLQAQPKKTGPPPGFRKPEVAAAPPGLSAHPPSWGLTPPGMNSTPHTSTSSLSVSSSAMSIPMAVKLNMYTYVLPQDAKKRNTALVSRVRQLLILKDDGFDQFRALSTEFRSGQVNAKLYHKTCQDLFGKEKFLDVLPEMVALLPDILKQHELVEAHKQDILGLCAPLNLPSCPTCCQLLAAEDLPVHLTTHANLATDIASTGFAAAGLPVKT